MFSAQPAWSASFPFNGMQYRVRFEWPGVLTVFDRYTGELIAKSEPGRPTCVANQ